jgi:hypothetical protein
MSEKKKEKVVEPRRWRIPTFISDEKKRLVKGIMRLYKLHGIKRYSDRPWTSFRTEELRIHFNRLMKGEPEWMFQMAKARKDKKLRSLSEEPYQPYVEPTRQLAFEGFDEDW